MSYLLGIDLGATAVTAAVLHPGAVTAEPVRLGGRSGALPAVLVATPAGNLLCGEPARRRAPGDPDRVARGFLHRVGDPTPLSLGGVAHRAEDLCARLVRFAVDEVGARLGAAPSRIGVTCPATWGRHKTDLLSGALARHGLSAPLVAAPRAVALAARTVVPGGRPLAVVDLGGNGSTATVCAPAGPGELPQVSGRTLSGHTGGADVDDAVFAFVRKATPELTRSFDVLDTDDPSVLDAIAVLRDDCRAAKEQLSGETVTGVRVALPGVRTTVRIHRSDLDELARPMLAPVAELLDDVLSAAPEAEVLLTGGTARMPAAVQVLSASAGRPVRVSADPAYDAARGAALAVAPGAARPVPVTRRAEEPGSRTPAPRSPRDVPVATPGPRIPSPRSPEESARRAGRYAAGRTSVAAPTPVTGASIAVGLLEATARSTPVADPVARTVRTAARTARSQSPRFEPGPVLDPLDSVVSRDTAMSSRRSPVRSRLLVAAGGVAGVAAVAGALLFWPGSAAPLGQSSASARISEEPAPESPAAPAPDEQPAAAQPARRDPVLTAQTSSTESAAVGGAAPARPRRAAHGGAPAPAAPARPPVTAAPVAPVRPAPKPAAPVIPPKASTPTTPPKTGPTTEGATTPPPAVPVPPASIPPASTTLATPVA